MERQPNKREKIFDNPYIEGHKIIVKAPEHCCLFCLHCKDILYDLHGPYLMSCELHNNTMECGGAFGNCKDFIDEEGGQHDSNL